MAESFVQAPPNSSGIKLHTFQRTIGANNVDDEVVLNGEAYLATYLTGSVSSLSLATANSHVFQIMAGASLNLYIRRIRVFQTVVATTAALLQLWLVRLTTAGTGGTSHTPAPFDLADAAAGATSMDLPTVKGTEGAVVALNGAMAIQTVPTGGPGQASLLADWDFEKLRGKALRVSAGTANGLAIKNPTAVAAASVVVEIYFSEANF